MFKSLQAAQDRMITLRHYHYDLVLTRQQRIDLDHEMKAVQKFIDSYVK